MAAGPDTNRSAGLHSDPSRPLARRSCRTIQSPRLTVRPLSPRDLDELLAVNGDAEVTKFLPDATWAGRSDAEAWLARMSALAGHRVQRSQASHWNAFSVPS